MEKEFLYEMKLEYDRRNMASDRLARKARDLMTVSVIMITAITAFYGHMWNITDQKDLLFHLPLISVVVLGLSALLCVRSHGMEVQKTVFLGEKNGGLE